MLWGALPSVISYYFLPIGVIMNWFNIAELKPPYDVQVELLNSEDGDTCYALNQLQRPACEFTVIKDGDFQQLNFKPTHWRYPNQEKVPYYYFCINYGYDGHISYSDSHISEVEATHEIALDKTRVMSFTRERNIYFASCSRELLLNRYNGVKLGLDIKNMTFSEIKNKIGTL